VFNHWSGLTGQVVDNAMYEGAFDHEDVVIYNKLWQKAHLVSNGGYFGSWAQFVNHSPRTGRPVLRRDPVFGETEAFYTTLGQAEYWGYNYLPYCNIDNFRFPIRGYTWNTKSNDPTYWDWINIPQAIKAWEDVYSRENPKGILPKNNMGNYYERYYPQAFVES